MIGMLITSPFLNLFGYLLVSYLGVEPLLLFLLVLYHQGFIMLSQLCHDLCQVLLFWLISYRHVNVQRHLSSQQAHLLWGKKKSRKCVNNLSPPSGARARQTAAEDCHVILRQVPPPRGCSLDRQAPLSDFPLAFRGLSRRNSDYV